MNSPAFLRTALVLVIGATARKQGPWQVDTGAVEALKPEYRLALARDAYMLVRCEGAVFKPEV